jgi:hypothetical protein
MATVGHTHKIRGAPDHSKSMEDAWATLPGSPSCVGVGISSPLDSPEPMTDSALEGKAAVCRSTVRSGMPIAISAADVAMAGSPVLAMPEMLGLLGRRQDALFQDSRELRGVTIGIGCERPGALLAHEDVDMRVHDVLLDLGSCAKDASGLSAMGASEAASSGARITTA